MDKSIQNLRERRVVLAKECKQLLDDHQGDKWSKASRRKIDAKYAEIDDIDSQIARRKKQLEIEAESTENEADRGRTPRRAPAQRRRRRLAAGSRPRDLRQVAARR
jgi:HK97 family phage major capsid protein